MRDLTRRLLKLEGNGAGNIVRPDPEAAWASKIQTAILACWKGDYNGRESLAEAHCRAIGYSNFREYKLAYTAPGFEVIEHHNRAWDAFLAENGVGPNSPSNETGAFLERMLERVPERVIQGFLAEVDALRRLNSGRDRVSPPA